MESSATRPSRSTRTGLLADIQTEGDCLRRIRFKGLDIGKTLIFLSNHSSLPPLTICNLDKARWHVELYFKWINQQLRVKRFLGTSENVVKP